MKKLLSAILVTIVISVCGCTQKQVETTLATAQAINSTVYTKVTSGLIWLTTSYEALKANGGTIEMSDILTGINDIKSLVVAGDLTKANSLFEGVWTKITAVKATIDQINSAKKTS